MPHKGDEAYLLDMYQAAEDVSRFLSRRTREDFANDALLRAAVERKIEIIGEAARKVGRPFQEANAQIPWKKIMGTRHVLAHDYSAVDEDIVWRIATVYVPELIDHLKPLLPTPPQDPEP